MEKMKLPSIALGTWSWGVGFAATKYSETTSG